MTATSGEPPGEDEPDRLRARLAQIQVERAQILRPEWGDPDEELSFTEEHRSDEHHRLAQEEARIRKTLGLPHGEWGPGNWPGWRGWLVLTLVTIGVVLMAWGQIWPA